MSSNAQPHDKKPKPPPPPLHLARADGRDVRLRKGWTTGYTRIGKLKVPNEALARLTGTQSKILHVVESYSYGKPVWYFGDKDLAALVDCHVRTIGRARDAWTALGVPLDFTPGLGRGKATEYRRKGVVSDGSKIGKGDISAQVKGDITESRII